MSRSPDGPYARLHTRIMGHPPGAGVPLDTLSQPIRLMLMFRGVSAEMTLLRAGALVWPALNEAPEHRFGRVVAAQLADLAMRGHVWLSYGGEYEGPAGLVVTRHPDAPVPTDPEEALLLEVILGPEESVRLAGRTDGRAWDLLAELVNRRIKADGLAWHRRDRRRTRRLLLRMRQWMRAYAAPGVSWEEVTALHRHGYPYAVLFGIENGPGAWPAPPEEEVHLPSLLPVACTMAINDLRPPGEGA
ncbi:hypothetical protein ACFW6Q_25740 [Streptomyces sp. NPDC058737]|uniref:hypothetical protein n=1 Tax=Streptomyces sp. NPDC058737 TaxID=3346617 RepID=UPI0036A53A14